MAIFINNIILDVNVYKDNLKLVESYNNMEVKNVKEKNSNAVIVVTIVVNYGIVNSMNVIEMVKMDYIKKDNSVNGKDETVV